MLARRKVASSSHVGVVCKVGSLFGNVILYHTRPFERCSYFANQPLQSFALGHLLGDVRPVDSARQQK